MPKPIRMQTEDPIKCAGCNWEVSNLFGFEGDDLTDVGLCGVCFSNWLINAEFKIEEKG